ncbi:p-hydroxyphenylacetate 3-hydroxylase, reductase component [Roseovarius sp. A-2]|uniref:flavin reductase family protein n=1 Tax=Roseovarius sp. A-2 TaxID=1570360 RepID=UPI0009B525C5|nr:flavin reductase family protein [Roseovarius sp. A-2]GAW35060.1 p-hydroxyphenylacetate 3-hydroxylase, reductase component [Roseovarius sp. A-2]
MTQETVSVERDAFLAAMRQVASTVTVVTTDGTAGRAGATVSAFTSLSADPPSVLICLRSDSRIARTVAENRAFCVNILPEHAVEVARAFAGPSPDNPEDRFAGLPFEADAHGPILPRATAFSCALTDLMMHGSHAICIGQVARLTNTGERPLTYMSGDYHIVRPHRD